MRLSVVTSCSPDIAVVPRLMVITRPAFWRCLHRRLHTVLTCSNECRVSRKNQWKSEQWTKSQAPSEKGTDCYPHMPILNPLATCRFVRFWVSGGANSPKWEISCPGRPWTTVQNMTPLVSSSPEKSVTVQTNKNSSCYIHTLPISMCGYKESHRYSACLMSLLF